MAIKFEGAPEHFKYLEAGTFVYTGHCNEKPAFACGFQVGDDKVIEFSIWWYPEQKIFMLGPSEYKGKGNCMAYVPGDGADDPTMAIHAYWIVKDHDSDKMVPCETMTCYAVERLVQSVPVEPQEKAKEAAKVKKVSAAGVRTVSKSKGKMTPLKRIEEDIIEEQDSPTSQNQSPNRQKARA
eukprot:gnl/MRDRNA2_/MRDRNA2_92555_c0_seq1.p1 gnl/MRDRNA2_/MRDRNA2_92555_c0~~gnl/MRDRNA2_/MRDRNA2_92555_c0_seq1.p1  ORF type:complete len:211 (+),score=48.29 gnl/MRDRNA2_/MRDRNA2_92555_c0_seq1:88-633(+)